MSFACWIEVSRTVTSGPTPGVQRADGKWEEVVGVPVKQTVYDGWADVQDVIDRQTRDEMGAASATVNGIIFLQVEALIKNIRPDDHCTITWPDRTIEQALVVEVRRLDAALLIQRLRRKD